MDGLYNKYVLAKTDGKPIPADDRFMILRYSRINSSWDHLCRIHLHNMCEEIINSPGKHGDLQLMARELKHDLELVMAHNIANLKA